MRFFNRAWVGQFSVSMIVVAIIVAVGFLLPPMTISLPIAVKASSISQSSGIVSPGTAHQFGVYAATGSTISGSSNLYSYTALPNEPVWLANASLINIEQIAMGSSGDIDLYTVPSNRRAVCTNEHITNNSGSTVTAYGEFKSGGVYFPLNVTTTSVISGAFASTVWLASVAGGQMILLAGESLSLHTSGTGISVWATCIEYDTSSALNRTPVITSLTTGDNTVYTSSGTTAVAVYHFFNQSGSARTLNIFLVPNGSTASNNNKVSNNITVNNNAGNSQASVSFVFFANGDFIDFNIDAGTATQTVWVDYITQTN